MSNSRGTHVSSFSRKSVFRSPFRVVDDSWLVKDESVSLQSTARRGVVNSGSLRLLIQIVQFGGQLALVRLLLPEQFGLGALVAVLAGFAMIFSDLGINGALVHKVDLNANDLKTAFWLNLATGVFLSACFIVLSIPLAAFFGHRSLIPLIIVSGLTFSTAEYAVQLALLERSLRFTQAAFLDLLATFASVVFAVVSAWDGLGAMSLSIMYVSRSAVKTLLYWLVVGAVPDGKLSKSSARFIYRYCRGLAGADVASYLTQNVDNFGIGKVFGVVALAFYSRAFNLMVLPVAQVQQVIGRVLFPTLAALHHDLDRLRNAFERALPAMFAMGAPLSFGMSAAAPSLVNCLYGSRWLPTARLLEVLALVGPLYLIHASLSIVLTALGKTGLQFRRGLLMLGATCVAVSVGLLWGPMGVAVALLVRSVVTLPLDYVPVRKAVGLRTGRLIAEVLRPAAASVVMFAGIWALRMIGDGWLTLISQILFGFTIYVVALSLIAKELFRDTVGRAPIRPLLKFVPLKHSPDFVHSHKSKGAHRR